MKKFIKFRAYADPKKRYWVEVRVFDTAKQMRKDIAACGYGMKLKGTEGQVTSAQFFKNGRKTGVFAVMWLNENVLKSHGMEVVTHESLHAAVRYFERRGWPVCLALEMREGSIDTHERWLEERLAYAVGLIARYINRGLFRHKVWK